MKTETLQLISGLTLLFGFIFLNVSDTQSIKEDVMALMLISFPTFLYTSHIVGTKQNKNGK